MVSQDGYVVINRITITQDMIKVAERYAKSNSSSDKRRTIFFVLSLVQSFQRNHPNQSKFELRLDDIRSIIDNLNYPELDVSTLVSINLMLGDQYGLLTPTRYEYVTRNQVCVCNRVLIHVKPYGTVSVSSIVFWVLAFSSLILLSCLMR